jgi:hypothetical protein
MKLRNKGTRGTYALAAGALAVAAAFSADSALAISQSGEQRNMQLVGHVGLQGRGAYQPSAIVYPNGKTIAFVGLHNAPNLGGAPGPMPNPLNGGALEPNGTMIIDVTDPKHPVETFHIPVPVAGGQSQMTRMCLGSDLPHGTPGKVYLMRNVQGSAAQKSGYEIWDVTNIHAPVLTSEYRGLRSTHKVWWECNTGIAYMPGSKATGPVWRQSQSMVIVDWSNPTSATGPTYIRTYGLVGTQPGASGPIPPALHGAISAHEHPNAGGTVASGASVIGNRVYAAWGIGSDGVMQILDRKKLLTAAYGGSFAGDPDSPTAAQLLDAQVGYMTMSPDQGGHTSLPIYGLAPRSLQDIPQKRDIIMLSSEAGDCSSHNWAFTVDVTVENSIGVRQDPWQGPMVLGTMWVDPHSGAKFPRGDYCNRGQRFGVHSSEENFRNPYYGKLTFTSYFNAGVRTWDIRNPQGPVEVGFYVPAAPNNTYMTNNVEVDNRGYVYIVDRIGNGLDILQLTGCAKQIVDKGKVCNATGDDNGGNGDDNGKDD